MKQLHTVENEVIIMEVSRPSAASTDGGIPKIKSRLERNTHEKKNGYNSASSKMAMMSLGLLCLHPLGVFMVK